MSNIFKTPEKVATRKFLWNEVFKFLESEGWGFEKAKGFGKKRIYRITRDNEEYLASVKTTQDTWFAYVPIDGGKSWQTLEDVDVVLVASVDNKDNPRKAYVHWLPADRVETCLSASLNDALKRSSKAAHPTQGHWISLYDHANHVTGAGLGLEFWAKREREIPAETLAVSETENPNSAAMEQEDSDAEKDTNTVLMDAKKTVAEAFNVEIENVTIVVSV